MVSVNEEGAYNCHSGKEARVLMQDLCASQLVKHHDRKYSIYSIKSMTFLEVVQRL